MLSSHCRSVKSGPTSTKLHPLVYLAPQRRSVEVNVAEMEQVTTPAGSFKAYKLVRSESWSTTGRGGGGGRANTATTTYFYSPETKSIVKSSSVNDNNPGTVEIELIKFTPGN
jgi:hypothetical protein